MSKASPNHRADFEPFRQRSAQEMRMTKSPKLRLQQASFLAGFNTFVFFAAVSG
jgi:hypothetical protein